MSVLITTKRVSVAQLVDELVTKRATANQRAAAVRALQRANPRLSGTLPKGTPVVLPALPHPRVVPEVGNAVGADALEELARLLRELPDEVAVHAVAVRERGEQTADDLRRFPELVEDAKLRRRLTKTRAAAIARRADEDTASAEELVRGVTDAAPRWLQQLEAHRARLARRG